MYLLLIRQPGEVLFEIIVYLIVSHINEDSYTESKSFRKLMVINESKVFIVIPK